MFTLPHQMQRHHKTRLLGFGILVSITAALVLIVTLKSPDEIPSSQDNLAPYAENEYLLYRLDALETELAEVSKTHQQSQQFQTAAEGALRHLLLTEARRISTGNQSLLQRVQADDSTTNSPFSILSEHFATKAYVDGKVANLQGQIDNIGSSGGSCRTVTHSGSQTLTVASDEYCASATGVNAAINCTTSDVTPQTSSRTVHCWTVIGYATLCKRWVICKE